jgi:hypothetical protein
MGLCASTPDATDSVDPDDHNAAPLKRSSSEGEAAAQQRNAGSPDTATAAATGPSASSAGADAKSSQQTSAHARNTSAAGGSVRPDDVRIEDANSANGGSTATAAVAAVGTRAASPSTDVATRPAPGSMMTYDPLTSPTTRLRALDEKVRYEKLKKRKRQSGIGLTKRSHREAYIYIELLGKGSFGSVVRVRKKRSNTAAAAGSNGSSDTETPAAVPPSEPATLPADAANQVQPLPSQVDVFAMKIMDLKVQSLLAA